MLKAALLVVCICACAVGQPSAFCADDADAYCGYAGDSALQRDYHSAFMYYRSALNEGRGSSECAEHALFGIGEYYYLTGARLEAVKMFSQFVRTFPESKARPFALVYLITIARELGGDSQVTQDLERHIATLQQISLLFRKQKKHSYLSPMRRRHAIIYYIDKVECYADGKLLARVAY